MYIFMVFYLTTIRCIIYLNDTCMNYFLPDTLNTQVHETTKHTPYELVFGQPPRSLLVPVATFKGKIDEEELARQEEDTGSIAEEREEQDRTQHWDYNREEDDFNGEHDDSNGEHNNSNG